MKIVNNTAKQLSVLLNNKVYKFNAGDSMEVTEAEGSWILRIQPLLSVAKVETVEIHTEPVEMEKKKEPKAKKNVTKNKKSRK